MRHRKYNERQRILMTLIWSVWGQIRRLKRERVIVISTDLTTCNRIFYERHFSCWPSTIDTYIEMEYLHKFLDIGVVQLDARGIASDSRIYH